MGLEQFRKDPYLYLTTTGRRTGLPREIEIWFVLHDGHFYVFAERFHGAQWVRNIVQRPRVRVRIAGHTFEATARPLDQTRDAAEWNTAQALARAKYGWGDGLPVRITPAAAIP
jgi:deazaflavin-dependent oxidoreductase (nitroreductase family)